MHLSRLRLGKRKARKDEKKAGRAASSSAATSPQSSFSQSQPTPPPKNELPPPRIIIPNDDVPSLPPLDTNPGFLSRLSSLIPNSFNLSHTHNIPPDAPPPIPSPVIPPKQIPLKLRIVSWNMHDGVPSGDLEQLLGHIPPYAPTPLDETGKLPDLGDDADHPYHILVVAGQECPSISGLPMAFGAGYKIYDREKKSHKRADSKGLSDSPPPNANSSSIALASPPDHLPLPSNTSGRFASTGDLGLPSSSAPHPGGWSHLLDEWLVHGNKTPKKRSSVPVPIHGPVPTSASSESTTFASPLSSSSPTKLPISPEAATLTLTTSTSEPVAMSPESQLSSSPTAVLQVPAFTRETVMMRSVTAPAGNMTVARPIPIPMPRNETFLAPTRSDSADVSDAGSTAPPNVNVGPYELAAKERMMGIYLAVYVHRDVKSLIRGVDKDAVTAGLIGGRVGNKGGVGISLNVNGTTFLFVNAHLAAHGKRKQARLDNLAKIKSELSLDPFLPPDDPRLFAEEITEQYDHTFIFGDLNFRLDVSRLHADWLVKQKEYAQALTFDQLLALMNAGEFPGFQEAPIDFPPTFKYDVDHGDKLSRRKTVSKAIKRMNKDGRAALKDWRRASNRAINRDEALMEESEAEGEGEGEGEGEAEDDDRMSFASTVPTSAARSATELDSSDSDEEDEDERDADHSSTVALAAKNTARNARSDSASTPVADVIQAVTQNPAAQKAKSKWNSWVSAVKHDSSATPSPPSSAKGARPRLSPSKSSSRSIVGRERSRSVPTSPKKSGRARRPSTTQSTKSSKLSETPKPNGANGHPAHGHSLSLDSTLSVAPAIAIEAPTETTPSTAHPDPPSVDSNNSMTAFLRPLFSRAPSSVTSSLNTSVSGQASGRRSPKKRANSDVLQEEVHQSKSSDEDEAFARPAQYDTSSKKRVPSWCDRILYKTTVVPPPEDGEPEFDGGMTTNSRARRLSLFLLSTFSRQRGAMGSNTSLHKTDTLPTNGDPFVASPADSPVSPPTSRSPPFLSTAARSVSDSNYTGSPEVALPSETTPRPKKRSFSLPQTPDVGSLFTSSPDAGASRRRDQPRRSSSSSSKPTPRKSSTLESTKISSSASPAPGGSLQGSDAVPNHALSGNVPGSSPWFPAAWRWFPTNRLATAPSTARAQQTPMEAPPREVVPPKPKNRRKGDVECLHYGTLDDQAMARLRGRSDHRPIIGVYSIILD